MTLQQQTEQLLNQTLTANHISELQGLINVLDNAYYVRSETVIPDHQYDALFKQLKALESQHPELVTPDSPTQRVARGLTENFPTVAHLVPMLSLDNSYNIEDLGDFDERVKDLAAQESVEYVVEPKFDGSSIALVYENDILVRAATRGNGVEGDDITNNAKVIRSIPLKANFSKYGIYRAEIRGEVVIEASVFEQLNIQRLAEDLELFKNSRNTASGGLRMKDSNQVAKRGLEAFMYHLAVAEDANGKNCLGATLKGHFENIELLNELGFKTPQEEKKLCQNINEVFEFCNDWSVKRDTYNYEIDGMVIKVNDLLLQQRIGATGHHPRWAIAYKFKARQATTKLEKIDYQVGRTGAVTPVAKLTPVYLAGVTISSVSVHNADFIAEKDLRIGDTVFVERAGDVIPYIAGADVKVRTGEEVPIVFPTHCPSCNSELIKPESEAVWRCENAACPAQIEERLIHFVSKGAMDINGLGRDIIKRFIAEGIVTQMADIYQLDYDQILALEGWKEKSVERLKTGVEASKNQPLWRLIVALGIRHVGGTTAKLLAKQLKNDLFELCDMSEAALLDLNDIGPKVAESVCQFFHQPATKDLIQQFNDLGVNIKRLENKQASSLLKGQTFLFTGTLTQLKRNQAKELVEANGGQNLSGISAKLNYLVAGEKAGSKLKKAQAIETIQIISESDFLEMISQG